MYVNDIMEVEAEDSNMEERILKVARQLFIKRGFELTSMGDIAREAGINRTLLNYYFRTKEKLFLGIFKEIVQHIIPAIENISINDEADIFAKLEMAVGVYTRALVKSPEIVLFAANEAARDPENYFKAIRGNPKLISKIRNIKKQILKSMERGELRKMPIVDFVTTFFGLLFFPFLGKNIICGAFLNGDERKFNAFVEGRQGFIMQSLRMIFNPQNKKIL